MLHVCNSCLIAVDICSQKLRNWIAAIILWSQQGGKVVRLWQFGHASPYYLILLGCSSQESCRTKKHRVYVSKLRLKDVKKMLKVDVKGRPVKTISCWDRLLFQDRPWYCENLVTFWASWWPWRAAAYASGISSKPGVLEIHVCRWHHRGERPWWGHTQPRKQPRNQAETVKVLYWIWLNFWKMRRQTHRKVA